jgi:DNA-binding NarL/FixJ family response regulator
MILSKWLNRATISEQSNAMENFENIEVIIIGPPTQQRDLMAYYISREANSHCNILEDYVAMETVKKNPQNSHIVLWNWYQFSNTINDNGYLSEITSRWPVALYGVPSDLDNKKELDRMVMMSGIKGLFYENESLERLVKGIDVVCRGELWFSRKAISDCLEEAIVNNGKKSNTNVDLSDREGEILEMIASGMGNSEISEKLFISIHTVKTHVYNIFRKIGVNNRVQAALWWRAH